MSIGTRNAYVVDIPQAKLKDVQTILRNTSRKMLKENRTKKRVKSVC
jgi:hypothetical protein